MNVIDAAREAMQEPQHYWGSITDLVHQGWGQCFGRHRDSDNLSISNYETILERFAENYELNEDYRVEGSSHWAVGWTDSLMVRVFKCSCEDEDDMDIRPHPDWDTKGNKFFICHGCQDILTVANIEPIFVEACEIAAKLEDYPLLDEEDYSRREHEDFVEWIEQEFHYASRGLEDELEEQGSTEDISDHVTPEDVVSYLYENYSVSCVEDCKFEWVEESIRRLYEKSINAKPGQLEMEV